MNEPFGDRVAFAIAKFGIVFLGPIAVLWIALSEGRRAFWFECRSGFKAWLEYCNSDNIRRELRRRKRK